MPTILLRFHQRQQLQQNQHITLCDLERQKRKQTEQEQVSVTG